MPRGDPEGAQLAEFSSGRPAGCAARRVGVGAREAWARLPGLPREAERLTLPGTPARRLAESADRAPPQLHACVPGEGANPGSGPVPWSKVPRSGGARINYQPKTVEVKGGSAGLDLFSVQILLFLCGASSPSENRWIRTRPFRL